MDAPTCKLCGEKHWPREQHIFTAKALDAIILATAPKISTARPVTERHIAQMVEHSDKAADPVINGEIAGSSPAVGRFRASSSKFDKVTYQRDYMRKRRAAAKEGK